MTPTGTGDSAIVALRSPALRRYLAGQLQSVTGSWIQVVALSWVLVELHPTALGWVVAALGTNVYAGYTAAELASAGILRAVARLDRSSTARPGGDST